MTEKDKIIQDLRREVERLTRRGRWVRKERDGYYWIECSECGSTPPYNRYKREVLSDYCPWCGALMEEPDEQSN